MLLMTSYFCSNVPHWFAETYAKEFALRGYHLVLEVITLMVRNIVEGVRFTFIIKGCLIIAKVIYSILSQVTSERRVMY